MRTHEELVTMQNLPLEVKIRKTEIRIREWYEHYEGDVYVSFSGGKDSTVLLDICRRLYPDIEAVFSDTGLEYPEIRDFVKKFKNVTWVKPEIPFTKVIEEVGYPISSKKVSRMIYDCQNPTEKNQATRTLYLTGVKRDGSKTKTFKIPKRWLPLIDSKWKVSDKCCDIMKKKPFMQYEKKSGKKPIIGTMTHESNSRKATWLINGCNAFDAKKPKSTPMSFWTDQDVLQYIVEKELEIADVYGNIIGPVGQLELTGVRRTGCMFCMYGAHIEPAPNRFQKMQLTHPKQYDYCINKLGMGELMDFCGINYVNEEADQVNIYDLIGGDD